MSAIKQGGRSRGLTLIEVVVVICVVALLIALLIPAIQAVRETSRKISCVNNLKQIGLALGSYEATNRVYPQGANGGFYSAFVMILPFLDQTTLYNSVNFASAEAYGGCGEGGSNETLGQTKLNVLLCPSEPDARTTYNTNYAGNGGFGLQLTDFTGVFRSAATQSLRYIGSSAVTDGLSHTTCASEWKIGVLNSEDESTIVYQVEAFNDKPYSFFIQNCLDATRDSTSFGSWTKNATWYVGSYGSTLLNFNSTPQTHNCWRNMSFDHGNWPCSSSHATGVNLMFLDCHVVFVKNTVTLTILQAMSTKSGGENVQF